MITARTIASRAKAQRLLINKSQEAVAESLKMSLSSYRNFERTGEIHLKKLILLAALFGRAGDLDTFLNPAGGVYVEGGKPGRARATKRPTLNGPVA